MIDSRCVSGREFLDISPSPPPRIHPRLNSINNGRRSNRDTLCMCECRGSACRARPFFSPHLENQLHTGCCANRYATCSEQTANGRFVGLSLAPRFPLVCPRVILFAAGSSTPDIDNERRRREAVKSSRPQLLTLIR